MAGHICHVVDRNRLLLFKDRMTSINLTIVLKDDLSVAETKSLATALVQMTAVQHDFAVVESFLLIGGGIHQIQTGKKGKKA